MWSQILDMWAGIEWCRDTSASGKNFCAFAFDLQSASSRAVFAAAVSSLLVLKRGILEKWIPLVYLYLRYT